MRLAADTLVKLVPQCPDAYAMRSGCFEQLARSPSAPQDLLRKAALRDLQQAVHLNPVDVMTHIDLAHRHMDLAEYDDAIKMFERATQLAALSRRDAIPAHLCRYNIGVALKLSGRYEQAIAAFQRCRSSPGFPARWIQWCDEQIAVCETALRNLARPPRPGKSGNE